MTETAEDILQGILNHIEEHGLDDILEHFDQEYVDAVLEHAGVKGMKWGVRKKSGSGVSSVKITNASNGKSADIKVNPKKTTVDLENGKISTNSKREAKSISSQIKKNRVKMMSDQELKDSINRIKLEQEFKKLTAAQRSPGEKLIREVLASSGKKALQSAADEGMKIVVQQAMTSALKGAVVGTAKAAVGPKHRL